MKLIVAVHGILTSQTDASWPDRFDAWLAEHEPGTRVIKKEYRAAWWPMWNVWVKDPLLARGLANELKLYAESKPEIWFVSHSNGAVIVLKTLKRLGMKVAGAVFVGAAIEPDVVKSGVLDMVNRGRLGRAVAYSSDDDRVLNLPWIWPYGRLGRFGFTLGTKQCVDPRIVTRFHDGYGHSDYFSQARREQTFNEVLAETQA